VDFGKAKKLKSDEDDITSSVEGTYMFLPPECCSFDVDKFSMKMADIWAMGVTLYCLTFNHMPFPTSGTELTIMENICN
jgi:[calcium/calmodulin-dependent protein kinase] kinase